MMLPPGYSHLRPLAWRLLRLMLAWELPISKAAIINVIARERDNLTPWAWPTETDHDVSLTLGCLEEMCLARPAGWERYQNRDVWELTFEGYVAALAFEKGAHGA